MADVKVKLLRRLQDREKGETTTYSEADAKRLAGYGAVEIVRTAPKPEAEPKAAAEPKKAAPAKKSAKARKA